MIYSIIEPSCYQRLTNGLAIPNLCKQLGVENKQYSLAEFLERRIEIDRSSATVFVTESAFLRTFPLEEFRKYIPNGKIVNLGSDSILFNLKGQDEISNPELVDLWLDTMQFSVDYYNKKNITTDLWKWTISESYIEQIEEYRKNAPKYDKKTDYICLARLHSPYRKMMKRFLDDYGAVGIFGDGSISSELHDLYKLYNEAVVCIGTTSPAGQDNIRTMKGWRDWIAPFMGTLLIYDDNEEMTWAESVLPTYIYEDYTNLIACIKNTHLSNIILLEDKYTAYEAEIEKQKEFIKQYTLEKQFKTLFEKHNIIRREASKCTPMKKR